MSETGRSTASADTEAGFLDVAANALAIMILATMMLLVVSAPIRTAGDVLPSGDTPEISFPEKADPVMRPLYAYYFVSEAGVTLIDLDAIARAVAAAAGDASTEQGKMSLITPRRARRDWNDYRGTFAPDYAAIKAGAVSIGSAERNAFTTELSTRYEAENVVPTFHVLPEGIENFAPIYWALRTEGIPVRWYPTKYGSSILYERSARIFELPGALD